MSKPYTLREDDKATAVMAYTRTEMVWGDVVTPKAIRVGIWFKTDMAPSNLNIYGARVLSLNGEGSDRPLTYSHLVIPMGRVVAFHPMPNVQEPLAYDPNEPNRKMEPVVAFIGLLQCEGNLRIASMANLRQFTDVNRDEFVSLYDATISHPRMPQGRSFHVSHALVRTTETTFAQL